MRILLSYRRLDSAAITGRIYDRLVRRFGRKAIFMDIDSIPYGLDFRKRIDAEIKLATVVVAIIGTEWLGTSGGDTPSRMSEEQDPVRLEIGSALRQEVPIIPALVNGARMPKEALLPDDLKPLVYLNAIDVNSGRDFHLHVDQLIEAIEGLEARSLWTRWVGRARRRKLWPILLIAAVAVVATIFLVRSARTPISPASESARIANASPEIAPKNSAETERTEVAPMAKGLCGALATITAAADQDFAPLKVAPAAGRVGGTVAIPGFGACYIDKFSDLSYVCEATDASAKPAADAAQKASVTAARACLDGSWTGPSSFNEAFSFNRASTGDSILLMKQVMLEANMYRPIIMIYRHKAKAPPVEIENATIPPDICSDLTKVVATATSGFEKIKGFDTGRYWFSKQPIKGFGRCDINKFSGPNSARRYFSCRLKPFRTLRDAQAGFAKLSTNLQACLPEGWSREQGLGFEKLPKTTFHSPSEPIDVQLRISSSVDETYAINLDVDMD